MPTCKDPMPTYLNPTAFMWFVILCLSLISVVVTSTQGKIGPSILFLSLIIFSLIALILLIKRIVLYKHSYELREEFVSENSVVKAAMSDAVTRTNLSIPNCLYVSVICSKCGTESYIPFFKDTRR